MNRKACRLLVLSVALLCSPTEALRMSMNRKIHTNRSQSHTTTTIRGRLGHLRPRLWGAAVAVEESSPTSLKAAMKFKNFEEMLRTFGHSLVVVSFSNDLCGPCRLMKKEMSRVSTETAAGGNVKMFSVDTGEFDPRALLQWDELHSHVLYSSHLYDQNYRQVSEARNPVRYFNPAHSGDFQRRTSTG